MTRTTVAFCVLFALGLSLPSSARPLAGAWTASISEKDPDRLSFSMRMTRNENNGSSFDRSDFAGLTATQIRSTTPVPVRFQLAREAGTIDFEGTFRDGQGAGQFTFQADPEYPKRLRALGLTLDAERGEEDRERFLLTVLDVSTEFIRSMQAIGYTVPLDQYVAFRIFRVDPDYVRAMSATGFGKLSADKLVETRVHGVSPEYIREMRAAGKDLTLDEYVQSRIFQVTPEFAEAMERAGYPDLEQETLVQFRIHGVTPEFIREIRGLGYARVPAQQLIAMRIHGVTPEFIRSLADAGYRKVPIDKMVQMRIFDIDPKMVKALDDTSD